MIMCQHIHNSSFWFGRLRWFLLNDPFVICQRFTFLGMFLSFNFLTCLRNRILLFNNVVCFGERIANTVLIRGFIRMFHAFGIQVDHLIVAKQIWRRRVCLTHHFHLYFTVFDHTFNIRNRSLWFLNVELLLDRWELLEISWFIAD